MSFLTIRQFKKLQKFVMFYKCAENVEIQDCLAYLMKQIIAGDSYFDRIKYIFYKMLGRDLPESMFNNVLFIIQIDGEHQARGGMIIPKTYRREVSLEIKIRFNLNKDSENQIKHRVQEAVTKAFNKNEQYLITGDGYWIHSCAIKCQIMSKEDPKV